MRLAFKADAHDCLLARKWTKLCKWDSKADESTKQLWATGVDNPGVKPDRGTRLRLSALIRRTV